MTGPLHRLRSVDDDPSDVQRLLSSLPDPGPMPSDLVERIQSSLTEEAARRNASGATVYAIEDYASRRGPSTRFIVGMSGAAAAAALVGAVTVHGLTGSPDVSVLANLTSHQGVTPSSVIQDEADNVAIQVSQTDYRTAQLAAQARKTMSAPGRPLRALAAESAGIGPLGTSAGVGSCLSSLGLTAVDSTRVDLALFEGKPVAVLFTTSDAHTQVRVVNRECGGITSTVLEGPVSLD